MQSTTLRDNKSDNVLLLSSQLDNNPIEITELVIFTAKYISNAHHTNGICTSPQFLVILKRGLTAPMKILMTKIVLSLDLVRGLNSIIFQIN